MKEIGDKDMFTRVVAPPFLDAFDLLRHAEVVEVKRASSHSLLHEGGLAPDMEPIR